MRIYTIKAKCPWCEKPYMKRGLLQKHMLDCAKRPVSLTRAS